MGTRPAGMVVAIACLPSLLAACGPTAGAAGDRPAAGPSATASAISLDACARRNLTTLVSGSLTVATPKPLTSPWFIDDDPENGEGFESALVYALARELGFSRLEVAWDVERGSALPALAPLAPTADFAVGQMPIQASIASPVAYSEAYYALDQALVVPAGSPLADTMRATDLAGATLGAVGDEAATFAEEVIQPRTPARLLATTRAAAAALESGQFEGVIVDAPSIGAMLEGHDGLVLAGRFPRGSAPIEYGLAFAPGNPLVGCVNAALAAMEARGELEALEREWFAEGSARVIRPE